MLPYANTKLIIPTFKWYKTRKPILQIKILHRIGLKGEMSVSEAEKKLDKEGHYHSDRLVIHMVLDDKGLIQGK